jgi:predicted choloylglycine hydrolase
LKPKRRRWDLRFRAVAEAEPGPRWAGLFAEHWPAYRRWYLADTAHRHPSLAECEAALVHHLPELVPSWLSCCALTGGDDLAARFLSQWGLPPHVRGCSQAAWRRGEPALVRNYDYVPELIDALVLRTAWEGRAVLGVSDCLVGLLDGVNDAGLAVSLSFGGARDWGVGFAAPLILRYLLQTCASLEQARSVLARVPFHMAYNVTVLDEHGGCLTAFVGPNRPATFTSQEAVTNHQLSVTWPRHAEATGSLERERVLTERLARPELDREAFVQGFLEPPLRSTGYGRGFGTLYTAAWEPAARRGRLLWPGREWRLALDGFEESEARVTLHDG